MGLLAVDEDGDDDDDDDGPAAADDEEEDAAEGKAKFECVSWRALGTFVRDGDAPSFCSSASASGFCDWICRIARRSVRPFNYRFNRYICEKCTFYCLGNPFLCLASLGPPPVTFHTSMLSQSNITRMLSLRPSNSNKVCELVPGLVCSVVNLLVDFEISCSEIEIIMWHLRLNLVCELVVFDRLVVVAFLECSVAL